MGTQDPGVSCSSSTKPITRLLSWVHHPLESGLCCWHAHPWTHWCACVCVCVCVESGHAGWAAVRMSAGPPLNYEMELAWEEGAAGLVPPTLTCRASQVAPVVKNPPASAGDVGSIPGSGRSPGGGHGNPLQYSCLENPMDRGAWQATVHMVAKSQTWLKWLSTRACMHCNVWCGTLKSSRILSPTWPSRGL